MSDAIPRPGLADWFNQIIDGLCPFIATHAGLNRRDAPLVMVLWPYLRRLARRFAALVARGGAPARAARPGPRPPPRTPPSPRSRLPDGPAWLLPIVPLVGNFGGLLHVLLASEEFAALLAASPAVGRLMRPLCRMLNVGPEHLDLPRALFHVPARPARSRPQAATSPAANPSITSDEPRADEPRAGEPVPDLPSGFRPKQA